MEYGRMALSFLFFVFFLASCMRDGLPEREKLEKDGFHLPLCLYRIEFLNNHDIKQVTAKNYLRGVKNMK